MKKQILLIMVGATSILNIKAQTEQFDIATYSTPKGWARSDSNGVLLLQNYRTTNGLTSFGQIFLYPCRASSGDATKDFNEEWNGRVAGPTGTKEKPKTQTEKTPEGWTVTTGIANITQQGITYTCMLVTASGFGKVTGSVVNMAGQDFVADVDGFFRTLELDSKGTIAAVKPGNNTNNLKAFDGSDYSFIAPDKWFTYKTNQGIVLSNYQTLEYGCLITIYPLQPSTGNLETDVKTIFNGRYGQWQYRYSGEKKDHLSKGVTPTGLEYCMYEADMHKPRPDGYYYDYEDAAIWVIAVGKQIAVVTGQHSRNMPCYCHHSYESWRRFFNSFTVKNNVPKKPMGDPASQIVGDWMMMGSGALNEYIFAANGNYQYIGAYTTTTTTTDAYYKYINLKTSGFTGDGSYSINGNKITFGKHGKSEKEVAQFRIEKVNHGGTGWMDRLYMLQKSLADGKEFEVCYEKR